MAVGLPAVAFEGVSGVEDLVVSGESGILVRSAQVVSGNSNELFAEALAQLMTAPQLRVKMGQAAKTRTKTFQPEIVFRQWDQLIATAPYHR